MSSPDTPAFRMSSAAAASPPNPPPTICALMGLLPGLDGGKTARRGAFAPVRRLMSQKQMSQVVSAMSSILDRRYSQGRPLAANNRPVRFDPIIKISPTAAMISSRRARFARHRLHARENSRIGQYPVAAEFPSPATCPPRLSLYKAVLWGSCAETLDCRVWRSDSPTL